MRNPFSTHVVRSTFQFQLWHLTNRTTKNPNAVCAAKVKLRIFTTKALTESLQICEKKLNLSLKRSCSKSCKITLLYGCALSYQFFVFYQSAKEFYFESTIGDFFFLSFPRTTVSSRKLPVRSWTKLGILLRTIMGARWHLIYARSCLLGRLGT